MILKIQRYSDEQTFWLLDDIRKISVSGEKHLGPIAQNVIMPDYDICILDTLGSIKCDCNEVNSYCSNCKFYLVLICSQNNGEEISIAFDTIAYILNDNGKTIEKVVANYNK